jgi:hypothetical protein
MAEHSTVIGIFEDSKKAQQAIQELKQAGFTNDEVGFVMRNQDVKDVAREAASSHPNEAENASGGTADSLTRAIVGGMIDAIALLLLPVIGPSPAENALETTLPAAEQTLDRIEGAAGSSSRKAKEDRAKEVNYYRHEFEAGRSFVTIRADGQEQEASDILRRNGAHDVQSHRAS